MTDADHLPLPVPELVGALYLIPTSTPPADPLELVLTHLATEVDDPLRGLATHLLGGPLAPIEVLDAATAPPLPLQLLRVFGATDAEVDAVAAASHLVTVQAHFRPGWPPAHEWCARLAAAVIGAALDAPVIDAAVTRLGAAADLRATLPDRAGGVRAVDWLVVPQSAGDHGHWMTTKGLGRFGLPELQTTNVPPQLTEPWTRVMSGAAQALLQWWHQAIGPDPTFVALPRTLTVTLDDLAAAYGEPEPASSPAPPAITLRLELDPSPDGGDTFLDLLPPIDFSASKGEFLAQAVDALLDAPEGQIRYAPPDDDAMDRAIAEARSHLEEVRHRFTTGGIDLEGRLIVKFRLVVPDGNEYPWLFVTSWPSPGTLHGTSANDAVGDPSVRVGRPLVVAADDVVDWAIWIDGEGIVEGGGTNAALGG